MNTHAQNHRIASRPARRAASAFTLIELLLVMVILVVLASVVVPKFASRSEQAKFTAAKTDLANFETALDAFEIDNGRYPSTEEGLSALVVAPSDATGWHGPYIKSVPTDPWGTPYNYQYPGAHMQAGFDLYSYGPDKREGNDDIVNWPTE
jgi:general secretion pathway protein G